MDADAIIPEGGKLGRIINSRSAQASQGDCRKETSMQQLTEFRGGETDCPALKEQRGHPLTHFEKALLPATATLPTVSLQLQMSAFSSKAMLLGRSEGVAPAVTRRHNLTTHFLTPLALKLSL